MTFKAVIDHACRTTIPFGWDDCEKAPIMKQVAVALFNQVNYLSIVHWLPLILCNTVIVITRECEVEAHTILVTNTHSHTHTHTHARTHPHTHTHTHARTHARTLNRIMPVV